MQSSNTKKISRAHSTRKRKEKGPPGPKPLRLDPEKLERVHKALELMSIPKAPAGPNLFRQTEKGTLEQVGREADKAWDGVKRIFSLLNTETKTINFDTQQNIGFSGYLLGLTNIAQGIADDQRTGDSVKVVRIRMKAIVTHNVVASGMVLVIGRSKDSMPALADVFEIVGNTYSQIAMPDHDQRKADQWLVSRQVAVNGIDHNQQIVEFDLPNLEVPTQYVNATTTISSGAYWFAAISGASSAGTVTATFRVEYVDN